MEGLGGTFFSNMAGIAFMLVKRYRYAILWFGPKPLPPDNSTRASTEFAEPSGGGLRIQSKVEPMDVPRQRVRQPSTSAPGDRIRGCRFRIGLPARQTATARTLKTSSSLSASNEFAETAATAIV